jgi:hypothetical protein
MGGTKWCRLRSDIVYSDKFNSLPERDQRRYFALLCLASMKGGAPSDPEAARGLRVTEGEWAKTKANLALLGLVDEGNNALPWPGERWAGEAAKGEGQKRCPVAEIVSLFNSAMPAHIAKVGKVTDGLRAQIRARWLEDKERQDIGWWADAFQKIAASDFLMGHNDMEWQATLLWVTSKKNMEKIENGLYGFGGASRPARTSQNVREAQRWLDEG